MINLEFFKLQRRGYKIPSAMLIKKGNAPKCKTCHFYVNNLQCPKKFSPGSMDTACELYERKLKF